VWVVIDMRGALNLVGGGVGGGFCWKLVLPPFFFTPLLQKLRQQ
jgi:hypothetical protein